MRCKYKYLGACFLFQLRVLHLYHKQMKMKKQLRPEQINPVKQITKPLLQELRERINDALAEIAAEYGLDSLRAGNSSYGETEFSFKLEGKVKAEGNEAVEAVNRNKSLLVGYSANVVGLSFDHDGHNWTVTGIDLKKSKNPILVRRNSDGKNFVFHNIMRLPFADHSITWTKPY